MTHLEILSGPAWMTPAVFGVSIQICLPSVGAGASQGVALADIDGALTTNNLLGPYAGNPAVFHCPGDARFNLPIGSNPSVGWAYDSYAVTENVEGIPNSGFDESYSKMAQIRRVADCIIFVEQSDTRGFNQDTFAMSVNGTLIQTFNYVDIFATYHGNVGTFSFADGHAEARKWMDPAIQAVGTATLTVGSGVYDYQLWTGTKPNASKFDAPWLIQHCVAPNNP
jgi:prepilin-type processing-associated H-X9-DG protein